MSASVHLAAFDGLCILARANRRGCAILIVMLLFLCENLMQLNTFILSKVKVQDADKRGKRKRQRRR